MRRRFMQGLLALAWLAAAGTASAVETPTAVVRETIDAVLDVARQEGPAGERREQAIAIVRRHFDFQSMSRRVLATHWARASLDQRHRFVAAFTELLTRTYWRKISNYRGAPVKIVEERVRDDGYATVATLVRTDTASIPVDYRLKQTATGWQAYDVTIEQVSLVRNYRGSFQDVVRKEGIDGLLAQLERKVAALPSQ